VRNHAGVGALQVSARWSAVSLAVSGFLVATVAPWHPSIFDRPVHQVVQGFGVWTVLHVTLVVAPVLALFGAAGLVAAHEGRLGRWGRVGLVVEVVGVVATAALAALEAVVFPVLADRAPALLAVGGPLLGSPLLVGLGVLALGWPLGLSLLGLASARSGVFGRAPGLVLAGSGPIFLTFAGPFVPIAGALSTVVFGASQVWWGVLLWRAPGLPADA
jgi:hypothetical protein